MIDGNAVRGPAPPRLVMEMCFDIFVDRHRGGRAVADGGRHLTEDLVPYVAGGEDAGCTGRTIVVGKDVAIGHGKFVLPPNPLSFPTPAGSIPCHTKVVEDQSDIPAQFPYLFRHTHLTLDDKLNDPECESPESRHVLRSVSRPDA